MTGQRQAPDAPGRGSRPGRIGRLGSAAFATVVTVATVIAVAAVTVGIVHAVIPSSDAAGKTPAGPGGRVVVRLPARPLSYLGAYARGVPSSYAPLDSFAAVTKVQPNIALYYSGWGEPFQAGFARQALSHGAVPLIQIEPGKTSLQAIADGGYDTYLDSFARAVARYGRATNRAVIIGFAHEPNGTWYPWGAGHVSPATWVAAWRHVVTVFRQQGAWNVTWLWTINIVDPRQGIASPAPWWPGSNYVTWVGIDGYYYKPSWSFAPLFGPAIKAVRALTRDPILISETGAAPAAGKAAKIADLFSGVRSYGLLGVVWFDVNRVRDWRIDTPAAIAAYRAGASEFSRPSL
jgi:Glycosyl hydrolase family 26